MVDDLEQYFGTQIYLPLLKQANERLQRSDAPEAEAFRLSNQLQETLPRAQADQIMTIVDGFGLVTEDVAYHSFLTGVRWAVLLLREDL